MSTFSEFSFATLAQLKSRLNIQTTDYDSALTEALRFSSSAIERAAGRRLRRFPSRVERFTGGGKLIRLGVSPLAKMHYLRESYDRNFTDPDLYTELVQDVDYVLETDLDGERPGTSGILRRINGNWAGSPCEPAAVEARYTGGYKTDDEEARENATVAYTSAVDIADFNILRSNLVAPFNYYILNKSSTTLGIGENAATGDRQRYFLRINTTNTISPTWSLERFSLILYMAGTSSFTVDVYILPIDILRASAETVFESVSDAMKISTLSVSVSEGAKEVLVPETQLADTKPAIEAVQDSFGLGSINLMFRCVPEAGESVTIRTIENSDPTKKPAASLSHYTSILDPFVMEDDLRVANLIQAAHDHYIRSNPGALFEAQRGVAIASGSTIQKKEAGLLPYVLDIAKKYRRLY